MRCRYFLLAVLFCFAQWVAAAHAVEHAAGREGSADGHACELCVAVHDLATALPMLAILPRLPAHRLVPGDFVGHGRGASPAPTAGQRGPPAA